MNSTPRFLQGLFPFEGKGFDQPTLIDAALVYTVPLGATAQTVYFRAGNSTGELICVVLMRDGRPMRYFPIAAKGDTHVSLRVTEDLDGGTQLELHLAAPTGSAGYVVVDVGLVEV
jgi:assimilatory nitrate reductase catalytic subunit